MKTYSNKAEKDERARLKKLYRCSGEDDPRWGLIKEASRLHVLMDITWSDIMENGSVEMFQQTEKCAPYERERPCVKQYQNYNKQYQTIIKQLNDSLKGLEEPTQSLDDLLAD